MIRLDVKLAELAVVPSRSKAKELIRARAVEVFCANQWRLAESPSMPTKDLRSDQVRIVQPELLRYVSRGGLKLKKALEDLKISVRDRKVLDIGISTGGFTDCLLQEGAKNVVGVDVGSGQLAESLQKNQRLICLENVNVKNLAQHKEFLEHVPFNFLVMDVSFISCLKALPPVLPFLSAGSLLLILVKPQFEMGAQVLNKQGVVKDVGLYRTLQVKIEHEFKALNLHVLAYRQSQIKGQDGNQEFFVFAATDPHGVCHTKSTAE